ncbi:MAG TPA: hypothetical protein VF020_20915 [Chthoniobacterales bacterium]
MTEIIERQIDHLAPGFSKRIMARRVSSLVQLETMNPNLVGGTITGGANDLWQLIARPTLSAVPYRTPKKGVYLCSSSTPAGGGVHGMCWIPCSQRSFTGFSSGSEVIPGPAPVERCLACEANSVGTVEWPYLTDLTKKH